MTLHHLAVLSHGIGFGALARGHNGWIALPPLICSAVGSVARVGAATKSLERVGQATSLIQRIGAAEGDIERPGSALGQVEHSGSADGKITRC